MDRRCTYLRIVVTKRCNLQCAYCNAEGEPAGARGGTELSPAELGTCLEVAACVGLQDVLADRHYCFVSTQVAERALAENDADLFEASGIPDLYRQIARTLRAGPQAIKSENPRRRFNSVVGGITGTAASGDALTIPAQVEKFNDVARAITDERAKLAGVWRTVAQRVRSRAAPKVQNLLQAVAREVESGGTAPQGIGDNVNGIIARELAAVLDVEVRRVLRTPTCASRRRRA